MVIVGFLCLFGFFKTSLKQHDNKILKYLCCVCVCGGGAVWTITTVATQQANHETGRTHASLFQAFELSQ